jgi:2-methylcitrate dehydratase PrpD
VGAALGHSGRQITDALGIAGSLASGIIEYLAEGTWTKRLHAGWAAQSGVRAALLAANGFLGPRTVIEGEHGFFHAFADGAVTPDYDHVTGGLGETWRMAGVAFKPYACGTMAHPFIDCAVRLADDGVEAGDITRIVCEVGEGTVHRLWEPLAEKHRPTTPYSAKFSVPFCIAVGVLDRAAGLGQFTEARISDPAALALAAKVTYEVDPDNEYPRNYTGHLRVTLSGGEVREYRQPYLRGGVREKLTRNELSAKFHANLAHGGWERSRAERLERICREVFDGARIDFSGI